MKYINTVELLNNGSDSYFKQYINQLRNLEISLDYNENLRFDIYEDLSNRRFGLEEYGRDIYDNVDDYNRAWDEYFIFEQNKRNELINLYEEYQDITQDIRQLRIFIYGHDRDDNIPEDERI